MATILRFTTRAEADVGAQFREARREYGLSLSQAAAALGVSPATVENWEKLGTDKLRPGDAKAAYGVATQEATAAGGNNVIFGCYPLRLARQLLQLDLDQIAAEFGYTRNAWLKLEANARFLPREKLLDLEQRIRTKLASVCC
jgi:transcriptional regulator with XRE-family HTH domain